jgi:hypothetical protein
MPDLIAHIRQAKHNLECAERFLSNAECRDWAITAAFYAAIHFVEAGLTSYPDAELKGSLGDDSYHNRRQDLVRTKFGPECFKRYRKLREASQNVRYLADWGRKSSTGISLGYYSVENAIEMVTEHVTIIKNEIQQQAKINLN